MMRKRFAFLGLALASILYLSGCGQELKKENEGLKGQVATLTEESNNLKTQLAALQQEVDGLKSKVSSLTAERDALRKQVDSLRKASQKPTPKAKAAKPAVKKKKTTRRR